MFTNFFILVKGNLLIVKKQTKHDYNFFGFMKNSTCLQPIAVLE